MSPATDPDLVEFIGYTAAVLTTLAFVPQLTKTWRSKSAADLSVGMLLSFTVGVSLWLYYGLERGALPVVAANAATLVQCGLLLALRLRFGGHRRVDRATIDAPR